MVRLLRIPKIVYRSGCWLRRGHHKWPRFHFTSADRFWLFARPEDQRRHGTCVLHKCQVAGCFNPEHLYRGRGVDNMQDHARMRLFGILPRTVEMQEQFLASPPPLWLKEWRDPPQALRMTRRELFESLLRRFQKVPK